MNTQVETCAVEVVHSEIVDRVKAQMPEKQKLRELSDLYKVLSDPTRLQVLWALGCDELCVCDLAALLGMTMSAISHQLRALRLAGLVASRKDGKNVYYSFVDDHVKDILRQGFGHVNE